MRIGLTGATGLLGRELGVVLRDSGWGGPPRLLGLGDSAAGGKGGRSLVEFEDEPALIEDLTRERVSDLDLLFLAGGEEETRRAWELAQTAPVRVVDLTGRLEPELGAELAGWAGAAPARLVVVAHPAAQALAHLLGALERAGELVSAVATVFEPASERGWAGIQELEQQSVRLLALQSQPREVFDAQVAFNLRMRLGEEAQPSLGVVRERIARQLPRLRGADRLTPALELLQAPLFHASVISLFVTFRAAVDAAAVTAALEMPGIAVAPETDPPDAQAAAGEDAIQVSRPRADRGGFWLFATLDNLRRTAVSAVASARAGLEPRA